MANIPWPHPLTAPEDWAECPDFWRPFYGVDNNAILESWMNCPDVLKIRMDNLIGRMIGRHPSEIHPRNWPLVQRVWEERWALMAMWEDGGAPLAPEVPEVKDLPAPSFRV